MTQEAFDAAAEAAADGSDSPDSVDVKPRKGGGGPAI